VFAVEDRKFLGMNIIKTDEFTYFETSSNIHKEMQSGVSYISATHHASQLRASPPFWRVMLEADKHDTDLDSVKGARQRLADMYESDAKREFNTPTRNLVTLQGELIDKMKSSTGVKGVTKAFNSILSMLQVSHLKQQTSKTLLTDEGKMLRLDKQQNIGVFAIQPNKGRVDGAEVGDVYANVTFSRAIVEKIVSGVLDTNTKFIQGVREAFRLSRVEPPLPVPC